MPFVNNMSGKFGFGHPTADRYGSIRFNSSDTQYLDVTITAIGNSTATVEFWFNADAINLTQRMVSTSTTSFIAGDFAFRFSGGALIVGDGTSPMTSSVTPSAGVWNHVAWVGTSGTSQELFLNGSRVGTDGVYNAALPTGLNDTTWTFGGRNIGLESFNGYISGFRYVRGTALYSGSTYTVPDAPPYPIPGTELLLKTMYGNSFKQDTSPNVYNLASHGIPNGPSTSALNPF